MATIDLKFNSINKSLQVGDIAFYIRTSTDGSYKVSSGTGKKIGVVRAINQSTNTITVDIPDVEASPTTNDYYYFVKSTIANYSGLTGYYAEIKFTNNKTSKAELFSLGSEVVESSK